MFQEIQEIWHSVMLTYQEIYWRYNVKHSRIDSKRYTIKNIKSYQRCIAKHNKD